MSQDWLSTVSLKDLEDCKENDMLLEVLPHPSEGNNDTLVSHRPFAADGSDLLASVGRESPSILLLCLAIIFNLHYHEYKSS